MGNNVGDNTVAWFAHHDIGRAYEILIVRLRIRKNEDVFSRLKRRPGGDEKEVFHLLEPLPTYPLQTKAAETYEDNTSGRGKTESSARLNFVQRRGARNQGDRFLIGKDFHIAGKGQG